MPPAQPLPADVSARPRSVVVVLFSQADCEFCAEVRDHYLRPLLEERRPSVVVAESRIDSDKPIRAWRQREMPQSAFALASGVRFAPTVMIFDADGQMLVPPIVGLSRDFFGVYLEQRLSAALAKAIGDRRPPA